MKVASSVGIKFLITFYETNNNLTHKSISNCNFLVKPRQAFSRIMKKKFI